MGIINLTPDSFFDGGEYDTVARALARARHLVTNGADVLDLGAVSSRPGSHPVEADVEIARLLPPMRAIRKWLPSVPLSVDSWRASVVMKALEEGAAIVNDISGCAWDSELVDVLAQFRPGYVLMHAQGVPSTMQLAPKYENVVDEVLGFFDKKLGWLARMGVPSDTVVLDPGIGFGKTLEHNLELLRNLERLLEFGRPLLVGISMKSIFGDFADLPVERRASITEVACALLWLKGAVWHRVHDVRGARNALRLAKALNY